MKALATLVVSMFAYSAEAAPKPVKVMTYNIRYSDGDRNSPDNSWDAGFSTCCDAEEIRSRVEKLAHASFEN